MRRTTRCTVVAAGVLAATLAVAPAAHAGWVTQDATDPLIQVDKTCHDGLTAEFATFPVPLAHYATKHAKRAVLARQEKDISNGYRQAYIFQATTDGSAPPRRDQRPYRLPYAPEQLSWDGGYPDNSDYADPQRIHLLIGAVNFRYGYQAQDTQLYVSTSAQDPVTIHVGARVADCWLHAPFVPRRQSAKTVTVALVSKPGLQPAALSTSRFRLKRTHHYAGKVARPTHLARADVNHDGVDDLILSFSRAASGIGRARTAATVYTTDGTVTGRVTLPHV